MWQPASIVARETRGFTLLELLAATMISLVLVTAIATVLFSALNLRDRTTAKLDDALTVTSATDQLRRDLELMKEPNGIFAGAILGDVDTDSGADQSDRIEFYTASGRLSDTEPWGDIQKVSYYLRKPVDALPSDEEASKTDSTYELVRTETRNLLPSTEELPEEVPILKGVTALTFEYYADGVWQETWDSTQNDNTAPAAVYVRIEWEPEQQTERLARSSQQETDNLAPARVLEMVCPIVNANSTATTSSSTGSTGSSPGGSSGQTAQG